MSESIFAAPNVRATAKVTRADGTVEYFEVPVELATEATQPGFFARVFGSAVD